MENIDLEQYVLAHCSDEKDYLTELDRETHLTCLNTRMLSGHVQGRILAMICKMVQAEKILELGTYTGYSALCMAEALPENGVLHTIELNEEYEDIHEKYKKRSGLAAKIVNHYGDAKTIVEKIDQCFDVVFMDADKREYLEYYHRVLPKLNKGGYILADNVLWNGKVVDANAKDDQTEGIRAFNAWIKNDDRVEVVILPIRDGLSLIRKK